MVKSSARPTMVRKLVTEVVGWASRGLTVWENESVLCKDMISPATDRLAMNRLRNRPRNSPTMISMVI